MQKQRARKRLTRREIKEDKLLIWTSQAFEWMEAHAAQLIGGAVGLVLVILLGYGYGWYQASVEQESVVALGELDRVISGGNAAAIIAKADQIIASSGGFAVDRAKLEKADALRSTGDRAQAKPLYRDVLSAFDGVNSYRAAMGYADCLGAEGNYHEAGEVLAEWVDDNAESGMAPHALMEAAVNYELAGEFEPARRALQTIVDDFDRSNLIGVARIRLKMIEGAVAAAGS